MSEAEFTQHMASQCIVREAASLLNENYAKEGSFPTSKDQFANLISLNRKRFVCGPYSKIIENGLPLDSFGQPLQYIFGLKYVVVYTTSTSLREGEPFALKVSAKEIQETRIGGIK